MLIISILSIGFITGCKNNKVSSDDNNQSTQDEKSQDKNAGENNNENQPEQEKKLDAVEINIAALRGPTAIGMVKLMKDVKEGTVESNYKFTVYGTADEITTGLIKGDIQIAAIPCNLASVLYNKTEGNINIAAINTLGVLYIVEKGDSIQSVEDLRGKTIYSTGKGTTPEYTLNYLLRCAGIDPEKDVTIEYKSESTEVAALLSTVDNAIAMLPQPYVATVMMQDESIRIALDITKEWESYANDESSVVTGVVAINKEFYNNNSELVDTFLSKYAESVEYVNANVDEAAEYVEEFDISKAAAAKRAIPYCNVVFISGQDMKDLAEKYLDVLFKENPASIGGTLPKEDFYLIR